MPSRSFVAVACLLVALGASPSRARAQVPGPGVEQYLRRMGIGPAQLETAAHAHAVVKLLPTTNGPDVALFGVIRLQGPSAVLRARALDVERLLAESGNRYHVFADPATPLDVREAGVDPSEYRALRNCRPGECDFKLPGSLMQAFVQQVDWSSSDAKAQVDERVRSELLRFVADYRTRGNAALPVYDDVHGVRAGDVFAELVAQSPSVYGYAPELQRYLTGYPTGRPSSARDVLYWSEIRLPHLRPLLTVNHVVVYAPAGATAFLARKQIYASHYFEGAFELEAVVNAGAAPDAGVYLLVLRRFRFDNLPTGALNVRGRVRQQLVAATRADLEREASSIAGASGR